MKIPISGPDLRVKHSPTILGLVSFQLHLSGEGPKERWVGVEVPGLRSCVFQTSNSFLHSFHLLIFKDSATRLPPLGSPGRTEPAPPGGLGSLHSDGILSLCSQRLHSGLPHNWGSVSVGWMDGWCSFGRFLCTHGGIPPPSVGKLGLIH